MDTHSGEGQNKRQNRGREKEVSIQPHFAELVIHDLTLVLVFQRRLGALQPAGFLVLFGFNQNAGCLRVVSSWRSGEN
jgi:hypothetical protein